MSLMRRDGPEDTAAAAMAETNQDLGFGGRVAERSRGRLLNTDGTFNVVKHGLPFYRSLSVYHALLTATWTHFFLLTVSGYFVTNLLFAAGYLLCGPTALEGAARGDFNERFQEAFFFSVQTLATIGYGRLAPHGMAANLLVTLEAFVGLLGFALATGLLFARFSRPQARILFSRQAVVAPYRGRSGLMFRVVNERSSQLLEVQATVTLGWTETRGGVRVRQFHELALERRGVVFFPLHWVIVHPIDERSPLFGISEADLRASDAEVFILMSGVDETFSQTVHARSSYKQDQVVWGAKFCDMLLKSNDGRVGIDLRRFDDIEPASLVVDAEKNQTLQSPLGIKV